MMCGLVGLLAGYQPKRRLKEIDSLTEIFTAMLMLSEHRGPHATGVAWVKRDGSMQVAKEPLPARQFVQTGTYLDWLLGVDREITYLMGHTRWPSQGSVRNPDNNHPLCLPVIASPFDQSSEVLGRLALSHNGTIRQPSIHFDRLRLPRTAQVDSELLARLVQRHTDAHGIDLDAVLAEFSLLDGSMSLALVATTRPEEIILLKGNMPLDIRMHRRTRVLVYASEARILDRALAGGTGWEMVPLAHGEGLVIDTHAWTMHRLPFTFQGIQADTGNTYTGARARKDQ